MTQTFHTVYIADYFVDCIFVANIVVTLYVGFIDKEGSKVMMLSEIRRRTRPPALHPP